jgi:predicted Zn finger-like uncharacterized protein
MFKSAQLDDTIETSCSYCNARYRITDDQLKIAVGKVRCGECSEVFNAIPSLKTNVESDHAANRRQPSVLPDKTHTPYSQLSLHEAMYGEGRRSFTHFYPLLWLLGILLLLVLVLTQAIYYQRYELISKPRYQQQILNLCELIPCGDAKFSNSRQIKLLERNVFTHPVKPNALMMTGSFVNKAPFPQKLPKLLVTLFDIQGNLIANRQFVSDEYLQPGNQPTALQSNQSIQFRLEILDPGKIALTYEFEFL